MALDPVARLRAVAAGRGLHASIPELSEAFSQVGKGTSEVPGIDGEREPELHLLLPHTGANAEILESLLREEVEGALEDLAASVGLGHDLQTYAKHVLLVAKSCHEATALVVALLGDALRKLPELVQVDDGLVGVLVALLLDFPVDILNELLMPLDLLANTFIVLVAPLLNLLLQNSQQPLLLFAKGLRPLCRLFELVLLVAQALVLLGDLPDAPALDEAEVEALRLGGLLRRGRRVGGVVDHQLRILRHGILDEAVVLDQEELVLSIEGLFEIQVHGCFADFGIFGTRLATRSAGIQHLQAALQEMAAQLLVVLVHGQVDLVAAPGIGISQRLPQHPHGNNVSALVHAAAVPSVLLRTLREGSNSQLRTGQEANQTVGQGDEQPQMRGVHDDALVLAPDAQLLERQARL
mmetsp:Transcript_69398/g.165337  ORF Transcript_69398/g.165337 Transcript_69398/m.165337 type:complete len:410 (+) Transcript_69398:1237-2466(+)